MPFRLVFFWTDTLIYLLLAAIAIFAWYASRHEHLRLPWRRVWRRPLATGALVVLLGYVVVGLLDTVHLQLERPSSAPGAAEYSTEVQSLLDLVCAPLRRQTEQSYSAPLAIRGYTKEVIEQPDGRVTFGYRRLRYGGAHLRDPAYWAIDVTARVARGGAAALLVWLVLALGIVYLGVHRRNEAFLAALMRLVCGRTEVPWRTILVTVGCVMTLGGIAVSLSTHYHLLGTDQVGQDVFYESLKSIRTGLVIGTVTTLVMLPFAVVFGVMAGYFGGWVDDVIQYTYTTLSSIPGVLLIAAAILSLQVYIADHEQAFITVAQRADVRLLFLCLILGVTSWTTLCRLLRGETLKLREVD
jgi:peptide/nickel transport system permease protein